MDHLILSKPGKSTNCTIQLTGSKSESNRALILNALSKGKVDVKNLSSADDTVTLENVLKDGKSGSREDGKSESLIDLSPSLTEVNIGPAGTAMRFLTAYFAITGTEVVLTGTERMKLRPIGILVDALRKMGANIEYVEKDGFPPIKFSNEFFQTTNKVNIKGDISSQFITALLLVAPSLAKGLEFDAVLVVNADAINYRREEERHILYTICTRTLHHLSLFHFGNPSPFISGMDEKLYQITPSCESVE